MQTLPSGRMEELFKLLQIVAQTFRIFPVCCTKLPKKQHALAHHDTVFAHRALPPLSFSLSLSLSLPCCPSLTDFQPHTHTHRYRVTDSHAHIQYAEMDQMSDRGRRSDRRLSRNIVPTHACSPQSLF